MRIWVTGAAGSIGEALLPRLPEAVGTDLDVDVTSPLAVESACRRIQPDLIVHLAGAKHAPEGEVDPSVTARVNVGGTENVLRCGVRTVVASTCKAADPETVYGATKLIAERMTLNVGGTVARFHNVIETQGNVFETWRRIDGPLPVTECWRYFIHLEQAVHLVLQCLAVPSGRYAVAPGPARFIPDIARELYPGRPQVVMPPRRGDRIREPLHAECERVENVGGFLRITSRHDPRSVV